MGGGSRFPSSVGDLEGGLSGGGGESIMLGVFCFDWLKGGLRLTQANRMYGRGSVSERERGRLYLFLCIVYILVYISLCLLYAHQVHKCREVLRATVATPKVCLPKLR